MHDVAHAVADLPMVPWVLWNPPFGVQNEDIYPSRSTLILIGANCSV